MSQILLIGNQEEYSVYQTNPNNVDSLPIKNLPMCYFPFFYNNSEMSIEKMKQLVSLNENYSKFSAEQLSKCYSDKTKTQEEIQACVEATRQSTAQNDIDTEKLFSLLTILEEPYQPYNNNNIHHIKICIVLFWILVALALLKICNYFFKDKYVYFMLFLIFLLLVMCTIWSLVVTVKSF